MIDVEGNVRKLILRPESLPGVRIEAPEFFALLSEKLDNPDSARKEIVVVRRLADGVRLGLVVDLLLRSRCWLSV